MGKSVVESNRRIDLYDNTRAVLILFVIFGHLVWRIGGRCIYMNIPIYAFHMPLFFIVSGFTLRVKDKNMMQFLIKRSKRLLVPMLAFGVLNFFFQMIWSIWKFGNIDALFSKLGGRYWILSILVMRFGMFGRYWFFPAMLVSDLICVLILKKVKDEKKRLAAGILLGILGTIYWAVCDRNLPFYFEVGVLCCAFVMLGNYFRDINRLKKIITDRKIVFLSVIMFGIGNVIEARLGLGAIGLEAMDLKNPFLFWLNAVSGSVILLAFCQRFVKNRFFTELGKISLYMYGIHYFLLDIIDGIFKITGNTWGRAKTIEMFPVCFILVLMGTIIVSKSVVCLSEKIKIKINSGNEK